MRPFLAAAITGALLAGGIAFYLAGRELEVKDWSIGASRSSREARHASASSSRQRTRRGNCSRRCRRSRRSARTRRDLRA
jgi:hypothetical protein